MIPPVCFTCGHSLADVQVPYETDLANIENNPNLSEAEKVVQKSSLLDKYHVKSYCCRARVLGYVKLVDIIT